MLLALFHRGRHPAAMEAVGG